MVWGVAPSLSHEKAHVKSTFKKTDVNHTGACQLVQAYVHSKASEFITINKLCHQVAWVQSIPPTMLEPMATQI